MTTAILGDVAQFINGAAFKPEDWHDDGLPIIRIQNLTDPSRPFNRTQRIVSNRLRVEPGDLLVSWSATLGVFEWPVDAGPALVNQHIFRVLPRGERVDKGYLKYMLTGALRAMTQHLHGATMKHVNRGEFLGTPIPLPPVDEQRRIAAILDAADELRAKRRKSLALVDSLTESIFLDMFGDPVTNPMGWDRVPLADLLERIDSGKSPVCLSRRATSDEWGVLKLGAVTWCEYDDRENKALPVGGDPDGGMEVAAGDVLFARKNTRELVGAAAYVHQTRPKLVLSDLIFRLRLRAGAPIRPEYLHRLLVIPSKRKEIQRLAGGSAGSMPNISKTRLLEVGVELPPFELQNAFASRAMAVRGTLVGARRGLAELDALFASLQSRAFRGEL